jgi:hypothetical protein
MLVFDGCEDIVTGIQSVVTVTVTVNDVPVHVPDTGVTVYTAVPIPVKVPLILVCGLACALPPVTPPVYVGAVHVYVVPAGTPVGVTVKVPGDTIDAV